MKEDSALARWMFQAFWLLQKLPNSLPVTCRSDRKNTRSSGDDLLTFLKRWGVKFKSKGIHCFSYLILSGCPFLAWKDSISCWSAIETALLFQREPRAKL